MDITDFPQHIQDIIGNHPIFDIKAYKNNTQIINFDNERIVIELPYTLEEDEDEDCILVYYIDENNNISLVTTSYYDKSTNQVSFSTDHLSIYAIGYNKVEFQDIEDNPCKNHISFLAARKILAGSGNNNFNPKENITRAEFVKILSSFGLLTKDNHTFLSFTDVDPNDWYSSCIKWACSNNIAYGVNESNFNPKGNITQEEMAVIIYRFLDKIGYTFPEINNHKYEHNNIYYIATDLNQII